MEKISLEIENLSEVTKFRSPLVDINYPPFDSSWCPRKEKFIADSKKFVEENFLEEYRRKYPEKSVSASDFQKNCKILKIYDVEDTRSESEIFYRYELLDAENRPIIIEHCRELHHDSGSVWDRLRINPAN